MKIRYVVTRTNNITDVCILARNLYNNGYITDWGFASPAHVENGFRWWMEVK
jgi:hypothetical protein